MFFMLTEHQKQQRNLFNTSAPALTQCLAIFIVVTCPLAFFK